MMRVLKGACTDNKLEFVKVVMDVPTRWNSTFLMINTVLRMEKAVKSTIQFHNDLRPMDLSDEEWALLKSLSSILKVMIEGLCIWLSWVCIKCVVCHVDVLCRY